MSVIEDVMTNDCASWVIRKISDLPDRAKYRAYNSIRFLGWANKIFYTSELPVPACFCALHATEEAVATFISSAKESGYGEDAKINLRDHQAKVTISLLAQKMTNLFQEYGPAVAYDEKSDKLIARFARNGEYSYDNATLHLGHFRDGDESIAKDFFDNVVQAFDGNIEKLRDAVLHMQEARNHIIYADSSGMPSGFDEPESLLKREAQISIGLIWASVDIYEQKGKFAPLVMQALRTANMIISAMKSGKGR